MPSPGEHPFRAVSLAYEGGTPDQVDVALPMLRDLRLRATFYLSPTDLLRDPRLWQALLKEGFEIGAHPFRAVTDEHGNLPTRTLQLVEDELDSLSAASERLVAHPTPAAASLASRRLAPGARVLLAVGPEGGWDDYEIGLLASRGFQPVSIGPRTLRTDTACVALLATLRA